MDRSLCDIHLENRLHKLKGCFRYVLQMMCSVLCLLTTMKNNTVLSRETEIISPCNLGHFSLRGKRKNSFQLLASSSWLFERAIPLKKIDQSYMGLKIGSDSYTL